ncbi:MAG: SPFH domain-containing protein [Deltaproteobacteria bacterium]|nr:SPFH domain-containing protein [Deltaproteobacteria bacterium]
MGITDFLKRGVKEMMIARPLEAKQHIVWQHPDPTVPMYSQLTVEADEQAIFFRDGVVVGTLPKGRHTLDSSNIPFLSNLVDSFTGGNVLQAKVFFVTIREFPSIKFGGKIGSVEDPKSGVPVETMIHGEFSLRVVKPEVLVVGLVGLGTTENDAVFDWFRQQVLKVIRDQTQELIVKQKWPLLDVVSGAYTEEIEQTVIEGVKKHVDSYGVQIVRLGNFVIGIKDEDEKNLKKLYTDAAYVRMAGGMQGFQQFAAGKAMMGAGEGMAQGGGEGGGGNAMLGGAALGVGFGMANMFQQQAHAAPQQGGPQAPAGYPQGPQAPPAPGALSGAASAPGQATAGGGVTCPGCGKVVAPGKFCAECGKPLAVGPKFCANCGAKLAEGAKFCPECGTKGA